MFPRMTSRTLEQYWKTSMDDFRRWAFEPTGCDPICRTERQMTFLKSYLSKMNYDDGNCTMGSFKVLPMWVYFISLKERWHWKTARKLVNRDVVLLEQLTRVLRTWVWLYIAILIRVQSLKTKSFPDFQTLSLPL